MQRTLSDTNLECGINCTYLSRCSKRVVFGDDPSDDSKMIQAIYVKAKPILKQKLYLLMTLSNTPPLDGDTLSGIAVGRSDAAEEA